MSEDDDILTTLASNDSKVQASSPATGIKPSSTNSSRYSTNEKHGSTETVPYPPPSSTGLNISSTLNGDDTMLSEVHIASVTIEHAGVYSCASRNEVGFTTSKTVVLNVLG